MLGFANVNEREELATGIYAALPAFVFLTALLGAFVLPPRIALNRWLGAVAIGGLFIGSPFLLRAAHRSRIRNAIEEQGGALLSIKKLPFWHNPARYVFFRGEKFDVEYLDRSGCTHQARCIWGFFQGVRWTDDRVVNDSSNS